MRKMSGNANAVVPRLSITLPRREYHALQKIADVQRVSLAWVVRDAVSGYLLDKGVLKDTRTISPKLRVSR
jgi:hypothetical protein